MRNLHEQKKKVNSPESKEKALLGKTTKSLNPPSGEVISKNQKREIKQDLARELIGGRLEICGRVGLPVLVNGQMVKLDTWHRTIPINKSGEDFSFGGLMHCGNVWGCPVCASIITEHRRKELKEACENARVQGLHISMLTLTVPHYAKDRCTDVLEGISSAYRKLKNRKPFKRVKKEIGLVGDIRTLEVTYGKNGWHPHFHVLLVTRLLLNDEKLESLSQDLLSQWKAACVSSGLPEPNQHGLELVNGTWADTYVTKWGIEEEMTKGHLKEGIKAGHVSPFGLLDLYGDGDKKAGQRFKEFAKAFKGKRQLVWSRGLRDLLKVGADKSKEEIVEELEKTSVEFMKITYFDFKLIIKSGTKIHFLCEICPQGTEAVKAYMAWLRKLERSHVKIEPDAPEWLFGKTTVNV